MNDKSLHGCLTCARLPCLPGRPQDRPNSYWTLSVSQSLCDFINLLNLPLNNMWLYTSLSCGIHSVDCQPYWEKSGIICLSSTGRMSSITRILSAPQGNGLTLHIRGCLSIDKGFLFGQIVASLVFHLVHNDHHSAVSNCMIILEEGKSNESMVLELRNQKCASVQEYK